MRQLNRYPEMMRTHPDPFEMQPQNDILPSSTSGEEARTSVARFCGMETWLIGSFKEYFAHIVVVGVTNICN